MSRAPSGDRSPSRSPPALSTLLSNSGRDFKESLRLGDFLPRRGSRRSSAMLNHNLENSPRSWVDHKFLQMAAAAAATPATSSGGDLFAPDTPKISGIPCAAAPSRYTAPVHIDVGGVTYTSSLETLTRYPDSKIGRLFNGSIPIVLDTLKQHYFIDRDGPTFRHVLNFLRFGRLVLPKDFSEFNLLMEEAKFYDIPLLNQALQNLLRRSRSSSPDAKRACRRGRTLAHQCILLSTSPDLGERILVSGDRKLVEETFPEIIDSLESSTSSTWLSSDSNHLHRFPLNGFSKFQLLTTIQRLLNDNFMLSTCVSCGLEGRMGCEYLFVKKELCDA
ncbi:BTB/POZ domain-containing protein kctd15-like [Galendromus occidentalis]|uniref:BTB/POZ domain-containing protein kctd15-like n=1 Tax=Galendromus occidentalis TaxID=34638 RepID=A0AAJ7L7A4_9ACAR|nr:BTB/POZ domain-containing protein kctd15-like [Galendromus occidentalis]